MEKQIYSLQITTIEREFSMIVNKLTEKQYDDLDSFSVGKDVYFYYRLMISSPCLPYRVNYFGFEINLDTNLPKDVIKLNFK